MKTNKDCFTLRLSVAAVRIALGAIAFLPVAQAAEEAKSQEPGVTELTHPASSVEFGVYGVSDKSFKAGEYNGREDSGAYAIGNIDLRGGAEYDSDSALRYRITGRDLGLETRNIKAEAGVQGKFRFEFGYDELLRNRSDSYQTPYNVNGSTVTLPSNWVAPQLLQLSTTAINIRSLSPAVASSSALVAGVLKAPTAAQSTAMTNQQVQDLPAFHGMELYTKREKYDGGFSYSFDPQWEFKASVRHEDKDGYKPMSTVTRAFGAPGTGAADIATTIPDRIDQTTDQFNVSLGYTGDKSFLQAAYYGSFFDNHVNSVSWQNWGITAPTIHTMSSAPSNEFNQFGLTGGYNFTPTTKLVLNGSYARNTQNDAFLQDASTALVPVGSLDGLVVTTAFGAKLTAKPVKDLNVSAGYKYEDRDNQTAVRNYAFYDASEAAAATNLNAGFSNAVGAAAGLLKSNVNINANRPYSKKSQQVNLNADYRLTQGQWIGGGYDWQGIDRKCDGSWYTNCADADNTNENTVHINWRTAVIENVTTKLDYAYSTRDVSYNENAFLALVPMANAVPTGATASAYATMQALGFSGYGPALGLPGAALTGNQLFFFANNNALANAQYQNANRISELIGMRRFNMANRDRNKVQGSVNWQATDRLSLQAGGNFNKDDYSNSVYGLKDGTNWSLNFDGTFAVNENLSINAFYSHEDQQSTSAGNSYTANSVTALAGNGAVGTASSLSGGCFSNLNTRNASNKTDPCLNWTNDSQDRIDTIGLSFKQDKLLAGKLDVAGNLSYSWARTSLGVSGGNYAANPLNVGGVPPAGQYAAYFIPATSMPDVTTKILSVQVSGKYTLTKVSSIWAGYNYQHMSSTDYAYQGMQVGGLATVLPTFETAPSYDVHTVGASYIYSF